MKITHMRVNHRKNPLGYLLRNPIVFSWQVADPKGKFEKACRILISKDENFKNIIYDSGPTKRNTPVLEVNLNLEPRTRYYWKVFVWDDTGNYTESNISWFETGKMNESWNANWITPDWEEETCHPILTKEILIKNNISKARLYGTGLGLYEIKVNGQKISDELFLPGYNAYDKWIQVQTFDISKQLKHGKNKIEVLLGNGWYKGKFGVMEPREKIYGDKFLFLAEIHVEYEDGTKDLFVTDDTWEALPSPIVNSSIYDGEMRNYYEIPNIKWKTRIINLGFENLVDRLSPPIKIIEEIKPIKYIKTHRGERIIDMGQNMVGWVRFKARIPKGHEVVLQFGEVLSDGDLYRDNLENAKQEFRIIGDGIERIYEPNFTYFGFRYVKLIGFENININDFVGCVIHSEMERRGYIKTSNWKINRLYENILWSQKGNFIDTPTDCPQRSERLGWTGDAQVFSNTALYNYDCVAFYEKYLYDLWQEQKDNNGSVPMYVPALKFKQNPKRIYVGIGSAGWGDVATILPWHIYLHTGDKSILKKQYDSMKAWVDFIISQDDGSRIWKRGSFFGDWLALDSRDPNNKFGSTPMELISTAFYAYSTYILANAAKILEYKEDAEYYEKLYEEIKEAFKKEFITPNGRVASDTQTANVLILKFKLADEKDYKRIAEDLVNKIIMAKGHLTTGFLGTPYLCLVLSENNYHNVACQLFIRDDFPSWLYAVNLGATTIWERWDSILPNGEINKVSMNSLNHYAFGSIGEWMYKHLVGFQIDETNPGFSHAIINPKPCKFIRWVKGELNTISGTYRCEYKIINNRLIKIKVEVPFNCTATFIYPDGDKKEELMPGNYEFDYIPEETFEENFSLNSRLFDILAHPKGRSVLLKYFSLLLENYSPNFSDLKDKTLDEFIKFNAGLFFRNEMLNILEKELSEINIYEI
ncbi:Bacterial alpha-L-rhamnosidase [Dictyoglomus thermophilum]|uniref:alpha-L-rhamnosidase n=1 Tax=Dictyoglomus thermophilum TaxID=14 RepID=UPI0011EAE556|nr:alpha-L-rhamnosidase [Dictyoglomus thermophilum]TYT24330.1 Bacterial alpha-L-rhamnosidase [Dictyoglomus thermophilum]